MKKINAKNALRVLVAICAATITSVFTSCSEMAEITPEIPQAETKYVEVPMEIEGKYVNWQTTNMLYSGTNSYQSWILYAGNLVFDQQILEVAASQQGNPGFSTTPHLTLVSSNDNVDTYTYKVYGNDGQIATDTIKVQRGTDTSIDNLKVTLTTNTNSFLFGKAQATEVIVTKTIEFDVTLADGRSEHLVHNTNKSYIQSEVQTHLQIETRIDSIFVYQTDTITNERIVTDTLYQTVTEYVYIYETVHDTTVVVNEVEKIVEKLVEVHDTTDVYVHDTTYVDRVEYVTVTVVEEVEVVRYDTIYIDNYIQMAAEKLYVNDRLGYSTATMKVGNDEVLKVRLNLAKRLLTVPENLFGNATLTSHDNSGCEVNDGQSGVLSVEASGCTVNSILWNEKVLFAEETEEDGSLYSEVWCTISGTRINEAGETLNFEFDMVPAYFQKKAAPEPEPEPQVVTYSVGFSNETPANSKIQGTFFVDGSDGYHEEYSMPVVVYGLPVGIETLYVRDMTTYGHTAESTEPTYGTLKAKNGFNWAYDVVYTTVETQFKTVNDGLVGPYNRLTYKVAHVEKDLPNGQKVVWQLKAETVVDADEYVTDNTKSDHFCEEEQHQAHYEKSLHQHVTHYISGTVSVDGETTELVFNLQKVGNKYLVDEGTAVTNIYSTGD